MTMFRFGSLMVILAALLALAGCSFNKGSGNVVDDTRSVSGFSRISVGGNAKVIVEQNGSESLTISAEDNLLPYLTSQVRGDTLELGIQTDVSIRPTRDIVYHITVKELRGLSISGSGDVDIRNVDTDQLAIEVDGSGEITAAGRADTQTISISGAGDYQAKDLESSVTVIDIAGTGSAQVSASQSLDVTISGSGDIEYSGDPSVTKSISGSGEVRKR
jgi:hypothetical protein